MLLMRLAKIKLLVQVVFGTGAKKARAHAKRWVALWRGRYWSLVRLMR